MVTPFGRDAAELYQGEGIKQEVPDSFLRTGRSCYWNLQKCSGNEGATDADAALTGL
jgi:hypothetical protein